MARKKMARKKGTTTDWYPWGLYDDDATPEIPESILLAAAEQLAVGEQCRAELSASLRSVAIGYWQAHRKLTTPSRQWYRGQIQPIQKATVELLKLVRKPGEGTGLSRLKYLTNRRMNRPLRGRAANDSSESIEQLLESFQSVCEECLPGRGSPGAPAKKHVEASVVELAAIWSKYRSTPIPLSLDTEVGIRIEFAYPGPRFVQIVLQGIDPDITVAEIETALRKVLGGSRVRKSARR